MDWSGQQRQALKEVSDWLSDPFADQTFYLGGFAGTGKTTLAKYFAEGVAGQVLFMAYTGKAASVLRSKGCPEANTIHSYLYTAAGADPALIKELKKKIKRLKEFIQKEEADGMNSLLNEEKKDLEECQRVLRQELDRAKQGPSFTLNPDSPVRDCKLVILDEASMVGPDLGSDLLGFKTKILVLGDPAQLPPVRGLGYFTSQDPDVLLTEIHRQAAENPIIHFATLVREGSRLPYEDMGKAIHMPKREFTNARMMNEVDLGSQVLTGMNVTRRSVNSRIRMKLGHLGTFPGNGERLVVLKNNKELGVLNGVLCTTKGNAVEVDEDMLSLDLEYEGREMLDVPVDPAYFHMYADPTLEDEHVNSRDMLPMDFGYALTVHKSQGSQWDRVMVLDDGMWNNKPRDKRRWMYTAITRAAENLLVVS